MTTLAPTLYSRGLPRVPAWIRDLSLILAASLLLAALAQVEFPLPFTPVPITGETFGVLLIGAALGSKRGVASILAYLAEGAAGLPFFAGGTGGLSVLTGATAGYLVGFVGAAYVVGRMAERGLERSFRTSLLPFVVGTLIIYAFGVAWLSTIVGGLAEGIRFGMLPFLIGDAVKLIAASVVLPAAWRLVPR
jgi:biotin transport system substrate-specific component